MWVVIWMPTEQNGIKRVILPMPQKDKQAAFENKFQLHFTLLLFLYKAIQLWVAFSIFIHFIYSFVMDLKTEVLIT